jgi:cell division septation protein DedD
MKVVNKALEFAKLKSTELPQELKDELNDLKELIKAYNLALKDYDAQDEIDEEVEKSLEGKEHYIAQAEADLAAKIRGLKVEENPTPNPTPTPNQTPKKDGGGWGLLLGAVVLIGTLGLVNVLKKR